MMEGAKSTRCSGGHTTALIGALSSIYLLWGAASSLNHLLIQHFMQVFQLSRLEAGWLQPAYFLGYALERQSIKTLREGKP